MGESLRIGGLTRFTTQDFPGRLACVVHLQGCPLACRYCHAPHLRPKKPGQLSWLDCLSWLEGRRGLLDGVVFSGGEPCSQSGLDAALAECADRGFATGLHSSGALPDPLARILPLLDWIGLDWKAPPELAGLVTGRARVGRRFLLALDVVLDGGVAYEIRTTYHPSLLSRRAMVAMAKTLAARGVAEWVIQEFSCAGCPDARLVAEAAPLSDQMLAEMDAILPVRVRRAPVPAGASAVSAGGGT